MNEPCYDEDEDCEDDEEEVVVTEVTDVLAFFGVELGAVVVTAAEDALFTR